MYYNGSKEALTRGSVVGFRHEFGLPPGEFVTVIEGSQYLNVLGKLTFITNKGI